MNRILGILATLALLVAPALASAQDAPAAGSKAPAAAGAKAPTGEPLSADQVTNLFSGNTEENHVMKRGQLTGRVYLAFYGTDGSYVMREKNGFVHGGVWFVDPLGRICFRPGGKDKTKCDVVAKEGDHYIRLRDGGLRGRFTIVKGKVKSFSARK